MAYITIEELQGIAPAIPIDEDTPLLLEIASAVIDAMTGGKIGDTLDRLTETTQKRVKLATVEQHRTMVLSGGLDGIASAAPASVSLGRFSYSSGASSGRAAEPGQSQSQSLPISPLAEMILAPTGLLYAGMELQP